MTSEHIKKLRALPAMSESEAIASFGMERLPAILDCWPKIIDECCRLEAEIAATAHVNLDAAIEENDALKEQVQELTNQLGELTMGHSR